MSGRPNSLLAQAMVFLIGGIAIVASNLPIPWSGSPFVLQYIPTFSNHLKDGTLTAHSLALFELGMILMTIFSALILIPIRDDIVSETIQRIRNKNKRDPSMSRTESAIPLAYGLLILGIVAFIIISFATVDDQKYHLGGVRKVEAVYVVCIYLFTMAASLFLGRERSLRNQSQGG